MAATSAMARRLSHAHIKDHTLEMWDNAKQWTEKKSLKIPNFFQFIKAIVLRQRGGFKFDEKRKAARKLSSPDFVVILCLSLAYFCSVFARVSLSVLAPELQVDPDLDYDASRHGQVVIAVQISFMIGRLVNGFLIDMANPRYMFLGYLLGSASTMFILSSVNTLVPDRDRKFNFILGCASVNALFQSGTWSSATKFIHDHYRVAQYGKAIVCLAVFARMGSVGSMLILSALTTQSKLFWYDAMRFASGLTMFGTLPLLATFLYSHPAEHLAAKSAEEHYVKKFDANAPAPSKEQISPHGFTCNYEVLVYNGRFARKALIRWLGWWTKRQFVIVAVANAAMSIVCSVEGLEAFLTLYFFNGLKRTSQVASQSSIVLPLGVAFSLLFGGFLLERLDKPSRADGVIFMLMFAVLATALLLGVTGGAENALKEDPLTDMTGFMAGAIIALLLVGFFMGYAFFVPISTFAVSFVSRYFFSIHGLTNAIQFTFGGEHAALASSSISVFASCLGAAFSASVGSLAANSWTGVIGVVLFFSFVSLVSMTMFYYFELVDKRKNIADAKKHGIVANLTELVLHKPKLDNATSNPSYDSRFFRDPVLGTDIHGAENKENQMTALVEGEEGNEMPKEDGSHHRTFHEQWERLRFLYGPAMRVDGNRRVPIKLALFFTGFFIAFGVAMFVSYFVARSNPEFVYPFGDGVRFANKTAATGG